MGSAPIALTGHRTSRKSTVIVQEIHVLDDLRLVCRRTPQLVATPRRARAAGWSGRSCRAPRATRVRTRRCREGSRRTPPRSRNGFGACGWRRRCGFPSPEGHRGSLRAGSAADRTAQSHRSHGRRSPGAMPRPLRASWNTPTVGLGPKRVFHTAHDSLGVVHEERNVVSERVVVDRVPSVVADIVDKAVELLGEPGPERVVGVDREPVSVGQDEPRPIRIAMTAHGQRVAVGGSHVEHVRGCRDFLIHHGAVVECNATVGQAVPSEADRMISTCVGRTAGVHPGSMGNEDGDGHAPHDPAA